MSALPKAPDLLRDADGRKSSKERGYHLDGKRPTRYLPGALPNTWTRGDPPPIDAEHFDPGTYGDDLTPERGTSGDDIAHGPLEKMATPEPEEPDDPDRGRYRGPPWPDRRRDEYGWEQFYRALMRAAPYKVRQTPWTLAHAMLGRSSVCAWCNAEFEQAETGRVREHCSDKCRQAAYRERRSGRRRVVTKPGG